MTLTQIDRAQHALKMPEVDPLDRLPVQPEPARGMAQRRHRTQARHTLGQASRDAGMRIEPVQPLQPRTAARTREPQARHPQLHRVVEYRQVANPPNGAVVDRGAGRTAPRTATHHARQRIKLHHPPATLATWLVTLARYPIPRPATQPGHTIPFGPGRPQFVASRTTILPGRPCASPSDG